MSGTLATRSEPRYTPGGTPLVTFMISHQSQQTEAGMSRRVECEIAAVAMAQMVSTVTGIGIGQNIQAAGFLAKKSMKNPQLVLHVDELKLL